MDLDLIKILRMGLNINEFLTLIKMDKTIRGLDFPFVSAVNHINSLKEKGFLEVNDNNEIRITAKGELLLKPKSEMNFDDLFFLYPATTPNGRHLRTRNKEIGGRITKEYRFLKEKYALRVFDEDLHNKVIAATKFMLDQRRKSGDLDYLQQLEVYINRNGWERYMDEEGNTEKPIIGTSNTERI